MCHVKRTAYLSEQDLNIVFSLCPFKVILNIKESYALFNDRQKQFHMEKLSLMTISNATPWVGNRTSWWCCVGDSNDILTSSFRQCLTHICNTILTSHSSSDKTDCA